MVDRATTAIGPPGVQIAPIVDAGSSQSRADVLGILLSAVLLLTGLQWLALKPKTVDAVSSQWPGIPILEPQRRWLYLKNPSGGGFET